MAEYIEREKAKEEIMSWAVRLSDPKNLSTEDTMHILSVLPAADVVEVVRCKNCKNWQRNIGRTDSPNGHCFCHDIDPNGYDFCSYGERRGSDAG